MLTFFISAFFIVATAIVYTEVLTAQGMILAGWDKWLHDRVKSEWLLKPLGDCVYCFGGQIGLWSYPVIFWSGYEWYLHFSFVMTITFIIHIYKQIWN
jgi:hypothetical protein